MRIKLTEIEKKDMNYRSVVQFARQYTGQQQNFNDLLFIVTPAVLKTWVDFEDNIREWPSAECAQYKNFLKDYHDFIDFELTIGNISRQLYGDFSTSSERLYAIKIKKNQLARKRVELEEGLEELQKQGQALETEALLTREKKVILTKYKVILTPSTPRGSFDSDEDLSEKTGCCCLM